MFKIYKGGEYFFQWDLGQRLEMTEDFTSVHFCNQTEDCALVCDTYIEDGIRLVNVPNVLLQNTNNIRVYGCYAEGDNICFAKDYQIFRVIKRGKPEEYVYTEEDVLNYRTLDKRITELEENGGGGSSGGSSFKRIGFSADCDYIATDTDGLTAFNQALTDAAEGDTILVMAGTYKGTANFYINKDITFIAVGNVEINFGVKTQGGGTFDFGSWSWTDIQEGKHSQWYGFTFNNGFYVGVEANPDGQYYCGFVTAKNCIFNHYSNTVVGNFNNCAFNGGSLFVGHYYGGDRSTLTDCKITGSLSSDNGDYFRRCDFYFNELDSINISTFTEDTLQGCKMYSPNQLLTIHDNHSNLVYLNDTIVFASGIDSGFSSGIVGGSIVQSISIN